MVRIQLIVKQCNKKLKIKKSLMFRSQILNRIMKISLKNTTSISLDPKIFVPLIKNLKENNDLVVVNVDWGFLTNVM